MILLDDKTFHAALAPIRSESIGDVWHMPVNVDGAWRNVEVVDVLNRLVAEYDKLRAEAKRADEEATKLANSDLATTEQIVRALRVENAALREACTLALSVMHYLKGRYPIPVKEAEVLAKMQAALDAKEKP